MKLGAVDIGSNAIRFQVSQVLHKDGIPVFKKIEYLRYALRLGHDVFKNKLIGPVREEKLYKLIHAFGLLFEIYEVDHFMICATSAMREAKNGAEIAKEIKNKLGYKIEIIDGDQEADLVNKAIFSSLDFGAYLHIDVGGGSTELNVYQEHEKVASKSFKIGSVRSLQVGYEADKWNEMQKWVETHVKGNYGPMTAIGTGGNIAKLYDLATVKEKQIVSISQLEKTRQEVEKYSLEDRINILMLNPDRADVIIPASQIYISAMKWANCEKIMVPDVGLKDGILRSLYDQYFVEMNS